MSQEIVFDWEVFRSSSLGHASRPIAPVEIKSASGEWEIFYPEVDSGAIMSVFNESDCELLGYTLRDGTYFEISGVLGGKTPSYIHTVDVKIGNMDIIKPRIAFTEGKFHKQLLGRTDVFDKDEGFSGI